MTLGLRPVGGGLDRRVPGVRVLGVVGGDARKHAVWGQGAAKLGVDLVRIGSVPSAQAHTKSLSLGRWWVWDQDRAMAGLGP